MKRALKILAAAVLIAILVWKVDWIQAADMIRRMEWWTLVVVLLGMSLEMLLSVWKWSRSLVMHGLEYPFGYLLRSACMSYFLNNFLPTSIGGDAYRVYRTLPEEGYRSRAVSAVLIDRAAGFGALLTWGALGALFIVQTSRIAQAYLTIYALGALGGVVGLLVLHFGWLKPLTARLRHLKAFDAIEHNLDRLKRARSAWLQQIGLSFAFQATSIIIVFWLFAQTGAALPIGQCALITAAAGMAALMPLSINGIGLMEGSFVAMAVGLGADYNQALLVAIVRRLMMAFFSLLCGLVYLAEGRPSLSQSSAGAD